MLNLQKSPYGLLELLRLRTGGKAPDGFAPTLQTTVDATEFYGADLLRSSTTSSAAGGFPRTASGVVGLSGGPGGANRYLQIHGQIAVGAAGGTYMLGTVGVRPLGGSSALCVLGTLAVPIAPAGVFMHVVANLPVPLVLPPGTVIECSFNSDATGTDHVATLRTLLQTLGA